MYLDAKEDEMIGFLWDNTCNWLIVLAYNDLVLNSDKRNCHRSTGYIIIVGNIPVYIKTFE